MPIDSRCSESSHKLYAALQSSRVLLTKREREREREREQQLWCDVITLELQQEGKSYGATFGTQNNSIMYRKQLQAAQ